MKLNIMLSIVCMVTFAGALWLKRPDHIVGQAPIVEVVDLVPDVQPDEPIEFVEEILADEFISDNDVIAIEESIVEQDIEAEIVEVKTVDVENEINPEYEIFEGNSDYTGDDTTDNDAGNAGFEDDFPEAKYAYDDHSAEAYTTYTESFSGDEYNVHDDE